MTFELYQSKSKKKDLRFRLKADNGEIICQGEGYTTNRALLDAIELVKGSKDAEMVGVGGYYFTTL